MNVCGKMSLFVCALLVAGGMRAFCVYDVAYQRRGNLDFDALVNALRKPSAVLQFASLPLLQNFSRVLKSEAQKYQLSPVAYLLGKGKLYRRALVDSVLQGLLNKDPEVRLYCVYLLFHLAPLRSWIDKEVARILDPQNDFTETTHDLFLFYDVFGSPHYDSLQNALMNLLRATDTVVLICPPVNYSGYQQNFVFEWSRVPAAASYILYVDDVLYYEGVENRVPVYRDFAPGRHEWVVVVCSQTQEIMHSAASYFLVQELQTPQVSTQIQVQGESGKLLFRWLPVQGADLYFVYARKTSSQKEELVYTTSLTQALLSLPIPEGFYRFRLQAVNDFQKVFSQSFCVQSFGARVPFVEVLEESFANQSCL